MNAILSLSTTNQINIMKCSIYFDTNRIAYSPDQIKNTLTVQDIIDIFSEFDPEARVYFRNDGGYTYGNISHQDIEEDWEDESDEEVEN